jgi:hypothetical protein
MKLILETDDGKKIVVDNKNTSKTELAIDSLTVEYMFEQLRAKLEAQRNG